ncbi:nucleotide exchange factor SIL1 isoform X6 [Trichechus manatus latirostris]|uniref:Nucleotide exchange factor SIL1 n=1 Tax=Trichechus manatus latirostris TaxID=127582 RepID=A0A2Y9R7C9_TRIMA|nr:nucleotide exchange factor SIL1 isoform X6 [Trichechus manatus latirostris]
MPLGCRAGSRRSLTMAPQGLLPSRMALRGMLLGLLMVSCFTFCSSHQNSKEFALTNPEKSTTKETERKTKAKEELDTKVLEVFHPTHEWQALQPGQAVPAGSHVRLNLQTGAREVKLQYGDKIQNNLKESKKGKRLDINTNAYTSQDLKSALAKLKKGAEMESSEEDKARQAEVKQLFRPIEELKKDFAELNVVIETDVQIMVRLINKFNSSSSSLEEKIAALFDLEYYVHQMDNAQDLLSFGGLQVVINALNSTEPLVKEYAAFVLGAAFSSNPKVQVEAIEGGALQKLLVILATKQPLATKKKMFAEEEAELTRETSPEKLQQYRQVHLLPGLREQGWCAITASLLALPEHDAREKVLQTLGTLLATCQDHYRQDAQLSRTLASLQAEYQALAALELQDGEEEGYFQELLGSINSLLQGLR